MTTPVLERLASHPIPHLLDTADQPARGLVFASARGDDDLLVPYPQLAVDVRRFAAAYRRLGVGAGDQVALMIPDNRAFITAFLAGMHLGAVPVPIYPPMRIDSLGDYLDQTRHIVASAGARLVVTSAEVRRVLGSLVRKDRRITTVEALWEEREEAPRAERAMEDLAFLQYTSGSTSRPKGVALTYANLAANLRCIARAVELAPERDVVVSWLPLYHDMGLIGCVLISVATQTPIVLIPPLDFLKRPASWLKAISRHRGSLSFAPNFAYGLTARRVRARDLEGLDLGSWRVAGCGAEPIQRATLEAFAERFAPSGFDARAILPAYGLAESTLAVTFTPLQSGISSVHVARAALVDEGRAVVTEPGPDSEEVVLCGRPFEGHEVGILGPDGLVEEGWVGEVVIRGPSVTRGYFGGPEGDEALFWEGAWLRTGDLGFLHDGQLAICGRQKDLIIHNGRNYYASDIEAAACTVEGVRPGQVAAFGVYRDANEEVVVCVELRAGAEADAAEIDAQVRAAVMERFGLKVASVPVVPRGAIPKTSSGKVRRHKARELHLSQRLTGHRDTKLDTARHLASSQLGLMRHHITGFLNRLSRDTRR